jgi:indolepyruvate ferredoxin oxidoreductase alpha subunit
VEPVICADPGCGIRIHQRPFEMLHVKQSMGSAIGLAMGLSLSRTRQLPIALVGDSSFFHTGLNALLDAVANEAQILVIILDNGSAALTGGQPHPGSGRDARGNPTRVVPLERLLHACGPDYLGRVDPTDTPGTRRVLQEAIHASGLRVVVAQGMCVRPEY